MKHQLSRQDTKCSNAQASSADSLYAFAVVFDDAPGSALAWAFIEKAASRVRRKAHSNSQLASQVEYDILWRCPPIQTTFQLDADDLWRLELPRRGSHSIYSVGATDAYCNRTETASVWRVRVRA